MKTFLLIDGNAIMHRAYHALPSLTSQSGIPTNMIYGFFMMLHKVIMDFRPDYLVVCFDTPKKTFRQELMEEYQAQRPHAADDFKVQIPYIRQMLDEAKIARMEKDGYEADDVIGSLATRFNTTDNKVYILTGDKDIMQLVNENISVISPQIGLTHTKLYTPDEVKKKLNVDPVQIPDYKALAGDPSDNYIGVRGIGPKTASKLIQEYGTVENLIDNIGKIENEKLRLLLTEFKKSLILTKKIATIVKDLDVEKSIESYAFQGFSPDMKQTLMKLHLFSLLKKIYPEDPPAKQKKEEKIPHDTNQPGLF